MRVSNTPARILNSVLTLHVGTVTFGEVLGAALALFIVLAFFAVLWSAF